MSTDEALHAEIDDLRAEAERLRGALEELRAEDHELHGAYLQLRAELEQLRPIEQRAREVRDGEYAFALGDEAARYILGEQS